VLDDPGTDELCLHAAGVTPDVDAGAVIEMSDPPIEVMVKRGFKVRANAVRDLVTFAGDGNGPGDITIRDPASRHRRGSRNERQLAGGVDIWICDPELDAPIGVHVQHAVR